MYMNVDRVKKELPRGNDFNQLHYTKHYTTLNTTLGYGRYCMVATRRKRNREIVV